MKPDKYQLDFKKAKGKSHLLVGHDGQSYNSFAFVSWLTEQIQDKLAKNMQLNFDKAGLRKRIKDLERGLDNLIHELITNDDSCIVVKDKIEVDENNYQSYTLKELASREEILEFIGLTQANESQND